MGRRAMEVQGRRKIGRHKIRRLHSVRGDIKK